MPTMTVRVLSDVYCGFWLADVMSYAHAILRAVE
jgi:hypothetical protein